MTDRNSMTQRLFEIAEPVCADSGYELVDLEYTRGPQGWVVRAFIDHLAPGAPPIGFDDCEELSRELGAVLDVEDPLPHAYSLEVSSPGVDRPLRTAEHFRRAVGEHAKISMAVGIDGRKNFKGRIIDVDGDVVTVEVDGVNHRLPVANVASARLIPDWDALMGGARKARKSAKGEG